MLTRMGIPHGWYLADSHAGRQLLKESGQNGSRLPVVVFHSGRVFVDPSNAELAEALGFGTRPAAGVYDLVIIGAGPAGLAAAVYAASEGIRTLVVEPQVVGGQAGTSSLIRNYLGFPRGISGNDLANRALEQAWLFGANLVLAEQVTGLRARGTDRIVRLSDGNEVTAHAVVIASGVSWRRLGVSTWRRWSARVCSTARPGPKPGPCRARTSSWWARGTRPARRASISPSTPLR
jgi:thioredoxin reductase (NADPH)